MRTRTAEGERLRGTRRTTPRADDRAHRRHPPGTHLPPVRQLTGRAGAVRTARRISGSEAQREGPGRRKPHGVTEEAAAATAPACGNPQAYPSRQARRQRALDTRPRSTWRRSTSVTVRSPRGCMGEEPANETCACQRWSRASDIPTRPRSPIPTSPALTRPRPGVRLATKRAFGQGVRRGGPRLHAVPRRGSGRGREARGSMAGTCR